MAKNYNLHDIIGSARLNPVNYNANNTTLEGALSSMLSREGVNEANNSMLADIDFNGFTGRNIKSATLDGDIVTKAYGDANYGGASVILAAAEAAAAAASAAAALDSENAAAASETAAGISETNAATSEANALASEQAAAISEANAASAAADAIDAHELEADPHPGYVLNAELTSAISNHEAAADPHTGYLLESAKASQAEAEAGTEDTKYMTALKTAQAIDIQTGTAVNPIWNESGVYIFQHLTQSSNDAATIQAANTIALMPFRPGMNFSIDQIGATVHTNVAGSTFYLAIYTSDAQGRPTGAPVVSTGALNGAQAAGTFVSAAVSYAFKGGATYWIAFGQGATAAGMRSPNTLTNLPAWTIAQTTGVKTSGISIKQLSQSWTPGSFPSSWTSSHFSTDIYFPYIAMRVA